MVTAATGQPETGLNLLSEAGSWGSSHWLQPCPQLALPIRPGAAEGADSEPGVRGS